ncbi:MAG: ATP-grasp domain-containing protein [Ruminococcus sp.]|nr:ATP-grasp domain-containing protein [Ruminococcus sp.]
MNIWFNHWFSTAYHIINYMREADENIRIIGTNSNADCVYRLVCDEWYKEPSDDNYIEKCIDFCRKHKIDVFVPHHNLKTVCENSSHFEEIGTKVLANTDKNDNELIYNKIRTYDYLKSCLSEIIPEYRPCGNSVEFEKAVSDFSEKGYKVCFKLAVDEGGLSYHVIEEKKSFSMYIGSASHVSFSDAVNIIREYSFSVPVIVMPYLSQPEISVDCLKTDSGLLMMPRFKLGGRVSEIKFDKQIMDITESISDKFNLEMPYNVQYRFYDGKPYLLEINPRMSGGIQLSCTGSGINFPALALKKLLGQPCEWNYPEFKSRRVAHIETPVIIE